MRFFLNKENGEVVFTADGTKLCDGKFSELTPNTTDGAKEKHVPVVSTSGNTVSVEVGTVPHPMTEAHLISLVALETSCGFHVTRLLHTDTPRATFTLADGEKPIAAYEYCNLHGLWVCKI